MIKARTHLIFKEKLQICQSFKIEENQCRVPIIQKVLKSIKKSQNFTIGSYVRHHKQIKKVINIPSVSIDKKAVKQSKKANYYDMMDIIPENQDFSEINNTSIVHQATSSKHKSSAKNDESNRKVIISKINKN